MLSPDRLRITRALRTLTLVFAAGTATTGLLHSLAAARAQIRTEFVPTFSTNSRVPKQLERLQKLASQKLWDEWLAGYQQLVDDPADLVVKRDEEFLVGLRYQLHQTLAGMPPAVRQRYRALYDPEARRLFDKAQADNDAAAMRDVYSRYRFSSVANRALLWIANRALDRGQAERARAAYSRLAKEPGVTPTLLLRYAVAADMAGSAAEARAVLDRVKKEFGAQQVPVGGQTVTGAAAAAQVAKSLKASAAAEKGSWTSFAGTTGDRQMGPALHGELKKLWEFAQPAQIVDSRSSGYSSQVQFSGSNSSYVPRSRFQYLTFPVVRGDRVWIQGARNLVALNLADGKAIWDKQDFVLPREELSEENTNPRTGGLWLRSGRPVQTAPISDGHLLVSRLPLALGERDSGRWPADHAISVMDARTGTSLWRRTAGGEPRGIYFNVPSLQSSVILTGIAVHRGGLTEYSATALDAGTGETLWTTYLGGGSDRLLEHDGSPALVKDGTVWIESTLYTLNAVDLVTGELKMIYRYDPGQRIGYRGGFDSAPQIPNEPLSLVAAAGNKIVFVPRWGTDAVAIDSTTGKLLWASPKAPAPSPVGSLFAVDDKHAYVCGDHLQAISLADGSRKWSWEPRSSNLEKPLGYAALCGDRVYVAMEGKVHVRAADDGRELEVIDLSAEIGDMTKLSSIVALDRVLIVSNHEKVVAFGPK